MADDITEEEVDAAVNAAIDLLVAQGRVIRTIKDGQPAVQLTEAGRAGVEQRIRERQAGRGDG